jgi:hypothetical protein
LAFLLEIAAARFGRLLPMRFGLDWLCEVFAEVDEDVLLADHGGAVVKPERGDRVSADGSSQGGPRLALDRHLLGDVIDPELGQALADTTRGGAPLALKELEHLPHRRPPATTSRSESR